MNDYNSDYGPPNIRKTAKEVRTEIGEILANAIRKRIPILHVSHNDMDGFGCAVAMDIMPQYLNPSDIWPTYGQDECENYNAEHINIAHYHTGNLNDSMFTELWPLAYGFARGLYAGWTSSEQESIDSDIIDDDELCCERKQNGPILLITDISGFDLTKLVKDYSDLFTIIVIDHHRWTPNMTTDNYYRWYNMDDNVMTYRSWDVSGCTENRVEIAALIQPIPSSYIEDDDEELDDIALYFYVCSDHSATKLLMDIMSEQVYTAIDNLKLMMDNNPNINSNYIISIPTRVEETMTNYQIVRKVADVVSLYDTGNFGDWYINEGETNPQVSLPTALNCMFRDAVDLDNYYQDCDDGANLQIYLAFLWGFFTIKFQPDDEIMNLKTNYKSKTSSASEDWRLCQAESMIDYFIKISRGYDSWKSTTVPFRVEDLEEGYVGLTMEHTELEKSYTDEIKKYVAEIANLTPGRYLIRLTNPKDKHPMSIYAQKLLTEASDIDFFMEITKYKDKVVISLRSVKENANCVDIANANNGGGHIHAAGFTLK